MYQRPAFSLWIGFDPREASAYAVARNSAARHCTNKALRFRGVVLEDLKAKGLYTRPTTTKINGEGRLEMVDVISIRPDYDGRISTQHANARFLVKELAREGWAMFCDGDVLFRGNVMDVFRNLDPQYAVYCVKHDYAPKTGTKMDGQVQSAYARKNWSSVFLINCEHEANAALTLDLVNSVPGRELHRFCWIEDDDLIGALPPEWNYLVGDSPKLDDPKIVHFTNGVPDMPGYEHCEFSDEWRNELLRWAA